MLLGDLAPEPATLRSSLIIFEDLLLFIYVDMCVHAHVWEYLQRPEEVLNSPKARVTAGCEPPNMCAKTQIL